MAGVEVIEIAFAVEYSKKHGGIPPNLGMLAKEIVDVVEDACGIGAQRHTRQCALQHSGEQRSADSFTSDVGDDEGGAVIAHREHIIVITADGMTGSVYAGNRQVRKIPEAARQQR